MPERIRISVAYADSQRQVVREIEIATPATVEDAIRVSGILDEWPGLVPAGFGVFGNKVDRSTRLRDGDRVEIYRPLEIDPKEARRKRAQR